MKKHSEFKLLKLIHLKQLYKSTSTIATFIDLANAFDTVNF